jgi:hypothetical protein
MGSPDVETTHMAPFPRDKRKPDDYFQFLHPLSESALMVVTTPDLLSEGEKIILSREEINQANLKTKNGERIIYRATRPGDYPSLEPEQIETTERRHRRNGISV